MTTSTSQHFNLLDGFLLQFGHFCICGMGFASYLVYRSGGEKLKGPASIPLVLYTLQLLLNWSWSPVFFGYQEIAIAFYIIISLCIAIGITMISFFRLSIFAGLLLVPYLVWTSFATYLNYSLMVLNE
ncbi:TSPO [Lepeophtheirus salmonis]|uniref:TSPO n=1 Tax=Lepeophtheirus salmonis TaxID=72036 RepID=A0A7R8CSF2_LEPSM|nr:TSPO [Lepeophtheirus salmonis]CAF2913566.1 TSPO [Lepeophtheirus salmonis]